MKQPLAPWVYDFADAVATTAIEILGKKYSLTMQQEIGEAVHEAVLSTLPQTYDEPDDNGLETHQ